MVDDDLEVFKIAPESKDADSQYFLQHTLALFMKRCGSSPVFLILSNWCCECSFRVARRDSSALVCQLLLPVIVLCLGLALLLISKELALSMLRFLQGSTTTRR